MSDLATSACSSGLSISPLPAAGGRLGRRRRRRLRPSAAGSTDRRRRPSGGGSASGTSRSRRFLRSTQSHSRSRPSAAAAAAAAVAVAAVGVVAPNRMPFREPLPSARPRERSVGGGAAGVRARHRRARPRLSQCRRDGGGVALDTVLRLECLALSRVVRGEEQRPPRLPTLRRRVPRRPRLLERANRRRQSLDPAQPHEQPLPARSLLEELRWRHVAAERGVHFQLLRRRRRPYELL